ncbi:TetR/AcrR family transcriptional regulator [Clostridiaceae bacterium M8S5]|nr:TetR/AcrR family transcriptional regulator [Clostridiaceae bacterium M8S5]
MKQKYHSNTFDNIPNEKRLRILETAIKEFADLGYDSANINNIANKCGISIGSMYKYFKNKHDLYLTVVEFSVKKLKKVLEDIIIDKKDFLSMIRSIVKAIQVYTRNNVYLTKLYNQMSTENNSELVWKIAYEMENITADLYASYIKIGQDENIVRKDISPRHFAFFLDNLFILLQFSYSCDYYKERMKLYVSEDVFDNDDLMADELVKFISSALFI